MARRAPASNSITDRLRAVELRTWEQSAMIVRRIGIEVSWAKIADIMISGEGVESSDFVTGTSGWKIDGDGDAEFNDVTVRGDIISGNWDGADPADLSSGPDATATAGFYLDSSAGAAQFEGSIYIGEAGKFYGDIISGDWDGADPADLSTNSDTTATTGFYLDSSAGAMQLEGDLYIGSNGRIVNESSTGVLEIGGSYVTFKPTGYHYSGSVSASFYLGEGRLRLFAPTDSVGDDQAVIDMHSSPTAAHIDFSTDSGSAHMVINSTSVNVQTDSGISVRDGQPVIDFRNVVGSTTGRFSLFATNVGSSSSRFEIYSNEAGATLLRLDQTYLYAPKVYSATNTGAANVVAVSGGQVLRSTASSRRYKRDIVDLKTTGTLRPRSFKYKPEHLTNKEEAKETHWYFIAEEVYEEFGESAIEFNDVGEPEDVRVKAIVAILAAKVNRLEEEINELKAAA